MSDYQLDIDYPVEILRVDERPAITKHLPYDQHRIQKRHYGFLLEQLVEKLGEMDDSDSEKKHLGQERSATWKQRKEESLLSLKNSTDIGAEFFRIFFRI